MDSRSQAIVVVVSKSHRGFIHGRCSVCLHLSLSLSEPSGGFGFRTRSSVLALDRCAQDLSVIRPSAVEGADRHPRGYSHRRTAVVSSGRFASGVGMARKRGYHKGSSSTRSKVTGISKVCWGIWRLMEWSRIEARLIPALLLVPSAPSAGMRHSRSRAATRRMG